MRKTNQKNLLINLLQKALKMRRKYNIGLILLSSLLFITIPSFGSSQLTTTATSSSMATKDSHVDSGDGLSNYGGQDWLIFGLYFSDLREAYLEFDTSSPPANWTKAEIKIDMYSISETTQLTVSLITESWSELSINWMNKPAHEQVITTMTVAAEEIYSIDVTNFISGSSLSICINATTLPTGYVQACSKEGHIGEPLMEGPKIVWTYPTPTIPSGTIPGYELTILAIAMLSVLAILVLNKIKTPKF